VLDWLVQVLCSALRCVALPLWFCFLLQRLLQHTAIVGFQLAALLAHTLGLIQRAKTRPLGSFIGCGKSRFSRVHIHWVREKPIFSCAYSLGAGKAAFLVCIFIGCGKSCVSRVHIHWVREKPSFSCAYSLGAGKAEFLVCIFIGCGKSQFSRVHIHWVREKPIFSLASIS
jgi:hypothetical protein